MKIGIYIPEINPQVGGGFTFAETIISGLENVNSKDEIHIFYYGESTIDSQSATQYHRLGGRLRKFINKIYFLTVGKITQKLIFRVNHFFKKSIAFPALSLLDRQVKKQKIDLIWFPTPNYEEVDIPYVATVWDLEHRAQPYFPEVSENGEWEGREKYFKKMLTRASYVITGTEVGRKEISHFYGVASGRMRILPHPTPSFALASYDKIPSLVQGDYIFYPAQFWAHKNHVGLLKALKILKSQDYLLTCVFVGSDKGNMEHVKQVVRELDVAAQVKILGFVSREELVSLYKNALVTVYPSLCGPENLPPLEAMALGSPVVACDIEGAKEQLGDSALLVDCLNPEKLAQALSRVVESKELREDLISRGKKRALQYTQKEFLSDIKNLFEEYRIVSQLWQRNI